MPSAVWTSLLESAKTDFGLQWSLFLAAAVLKTERFYDISASATYVYLMAKAFRGRRKYELEEPKTSPVKTKTNIDAATVVIETRRKELCGMVCIWATRLGYFLLRRITEDGGVDSRFNGVRDNPPKFFVFWTIQAVWILAQSLPVLIAQQLPTTPPPSPTATQKSATEKHSGNHGERMTPADWVGRGLYLAGFALEVIADQQKRTFRSDIANRGTFITTGLWSISRHPNYLGEIMLWWGVFLRAFPVLRERAAFVAAGAVSPLFITFLLTKVSGIPLLERAAQKRWGTDIAYQAYKNSTAILLPGVW